MEELYKLKEMLCSELEEYGRKGEMSAGSLEIVDKLAHAVKNIDKIIECKEDEYSNAYDDGMMRGEDGTPYRGGSYRRGGRNQYGSYMRGRRRGGANQYGSYAMEGYSRNEDVTEQLRGLMEDVTDPRMKQELQRVVEKMERM